jgi:hypothetical protein
MSHKKIISILIIIIIALLGYAVYDKFFATTTLETQLSEKEIKSLVVKVSKLINVPEELPVVAKIIKAEELMAEQKFYTGSKDGDYLIVFPTTQKAMIYRESEDRLINVGPIIVDQPATTTKQTAPVETKATTTVKATTTSSSNN